ncbi:hypothetical protein CN918_29560 [Priestia megaterium]|nr:hypothetical protein CN918_29560 [Priestia megaterium]
MKAISPKDASHKKFITAVYVRQEWEVDENGSLIDVVTHHDQSAKVDPDNTWECATCGAVAKVE